jgi:hypothetical protein
MTLDRRPAADSLGPTTRAYMKSMGWKSLNLHTHISLVNRYAYIEVPKAGCGTMKATLGGMEAARLSPAAVARVQENPHDRTKVTPFIKPYQLPADLLEEVLHGSNWTRFAVVREPAARLLSGYLEKIRQGLRQSEPIMARLQEVGRAPEQAQDITFAEFIEVVTNTTSREQDPHWRRQADHLGIGIVNYEAVIHLEELDASWGHVASLVGVPDLQDQFYCRNSTGAGSRISEWYTPQLLDRVAESYAVDYQAFGYSVPSIT